MEVHEPNLIASGKKFRNWTICFDASTSFEIETIPKSLENVLQLPSARQILGHFIYLSETATLSAVKTQISNEVESAWINLNIYPVTRKIISK